jgi:hypothetical protein
MNITDRLSQPTTLTYHPSTTTTTTTTTTITTITKLL